MHKSLSSFLPSRAPVRTPSAARGFLPLREAADAELPIRSPKDNWETVSSGGMTHIQRSFEMSPSETKMLVCDILDAQEELGHSVSISIEGGKITVRSTTHEHGEPTERDREMARYIDTAYDEVRGAYR
jgi:pterin-4a-carbinolamine dehydratase